MITHVTDSALTLEFLRGDGLSLETPFAWGAMVDGQEGGNALLGRLTQPWKVQRALRTLPLSRADIAVAGHRIDYIQDILAHDADSPRWTGVDHSHRVADTCVPVSSIGGWYDIFLPGQLRDFKALQDAGRPARLMIGPWTHIATDPLPIQESIEFGLAHARGEQPPERGAVRLFVMGEEAWRDFESWPPPGYSPQRCYLGPGGALSAEPPGATSAQESEPDRYRYDPAGPPGAV